MTIDEKLIHSIQQVFPDFDSRQYQPGLPLSEIPNWDSMNSVSFTLQLESDFQIPAASLLPAGMETIADVLQILRKHGAPTENP